jgi:hypothetical protein
MGAATLAFILIAGLVMWQEHRVKQLMAEADALRGQVDQAASLREENQRLAERLKTTAEGSEAQLRELMRLRGQAGATRQTQQENARLKAERARPVVQSTRDPSEVPEQQTYHYTPEQWAFFVERLNFGKKLGLALRSLAEGNDGRVPPDLASAAAWLATNDIHLEGGSAYGVGVDQFELMYKGRLPTPQRTILAREKDPVEVHEGRWTRFYVFADGSCSRIEATTADGFAAREKELWPEASPP